MKKILALLLAAVLVFSFAACGKKDTPEETTTTTEAMDVTEAPVNAETQAPGWQVCLGGNSAQLLVHIARARQELNTVPISAKGNLLETILDYIQSNLCDKLSVAGTARHFHISQSTLTHLFHQEMGISFYRCVTQRRLAEAKNLIAQGLPMEQIGLRVGFQEYSAFYRAFKAEFGISPMQYRKLLMN